MKQIICSIIFIGFCCQYGMAQNNTNDLYFESITLNESGTIEIQAKKVYSTIDRSKKSVLLEIALRDQTGEMIFVSAGYNREIWKKDLKTGQILFVGSWDLNNPDIYRLYFFIVNLIC